MGSYIRNSGGVHMSNIENIFPANDFKVVCDNASKYIECGMIIGYSEDGEFLVFGGGILDGRQPVSRDWLWMASTFNQNLLNGDYNEER